MYCFKAGHTSAITDMAFWDRAFFLHHSASLGLRSKSLLGMGHAGCTYFKTTVHNLTCESLGRICTELAGCLSMRAWSQREVEDEVPILTLAQCPLVGVMSTSRIVCVGNVQAQDIWFPLFWQFLKHTILKGDYWTPCHWEKWLYVF